MTSNDLNSRPIEPDAIVPGSHAPALSERTGLPFVHRGQNRTSALRDFIQGSALPTRWQRGGQITIVELGLGAGLNLLTTVQTWQQHLARNSGNASQKFSPDITRLHYVAVEAHPLNTAAMMRVLQQAGFADDAVQGLLARWPDLYSGVHRLPLASNFQLTLCLATPAHAITELQATADLLWINRPRPQHQQSEPCWDRRLLKALLSLAAPDCQIISDIPMAQAQRALGPAMQAEPSADAAAVGNGIWRARLVPYRRTVAPMLSRPLYPSRTAAIVGAGIAGLALAHQLHHAGWQVTILEAGPAALGGGSAQPVLAGHVHFSRDDNHLARLTRNAQSHLARLPGAQNCPRWQAARHEEQLRSHAQLVAQLRLPESMLRLVARELAPALTGWPLPMGGLWQASSQILFPDRLLAAVRTRVAMRFGVTVSAIERESDGHWLLRDQHQQPAHKASVVVFCTASLPRWLAASADLQMAAIAGQSLRLAGHSAHALQSVLGADAYACPLGDGTVVTGSTWHDVAGPLDAGVSLPGQALDTQTNLHNWLALQAGATWPAERPDDVDLISSHAGVRHTISDRLPLIGALPDRAQVAADPSPWSRDDRRALPSLPGVYMAGGFGSRGALWAGLAASLITDMLDGAPLALEKTLAEAIAPQRFLRRRLRHNRVA